MKKKGKIKQLKDPALFKAWFEKVYHDHFERLYRYAFSITRSKDLAEETVEDVFVTIWEKKDGHFTLNDVRSYLNVSVRHQALKVLAKNRPFDVHYQHENVPDVADSTDPETLLLDTELRELLDEVTADLPPHCKMVYELLKQKGLSYKEAAAELGISERTVENHLCKALAKIRDRLSWYFGHKDIRPELISKLGVVSLLITVLFVLMNY